MKSGQARTMRQRTRAVLLQAALCGVTLLLAGCATARRNRVDQALMAAPPQSTIDQYHVNCPDVLQVTIDGEPGWQGRLPIAGDGRVDLRPMGKPRVDGLTTERAAATIAEEIGVAGNRVHVQVADYRSQRIYVFGQVNGLQRAVEYRGDETVLDLLRRVGGITPGAAPTDVYVIRSNIADGGRPEVHTINLRDIVMKKDMKTNLHLEPSDQICIGETRKSVFGKCVPPFIRPLYDKIAGLYRPGQYAFWRKSEAGAGRNCSARSAPFGRG